MNFDERDLYYFVMESNIIEQIYREPLQEEIDELKRFMSEDTITVQRLQRFVAVYEPDAELRDKYGLDVKVGTYYPPFGSPEMKDELEKLLSSHLDHHDLHIAYEKLHPFTDCNGRSGRALWAWKRQVISGGFLINFYFDQLKRS